MRNEIDEYIKGAPIDEMYTARDVTDSIKSGSMSRARHYLNVLVKDGTLMKLTYDSVIYYLHPDWYVVLEEFKKTGILIE